MIHLTSLRVRVFWSLIPILCVLFVLLGFVDLYQQKQLAEDEVNRRAQAMAENLAYSSRLAVLTEDKRLLEAALQSVTGAADFAYVWIYGENWTPLALAGGKAVDLKRLNPELEDKQKNHLLYEGGSLVNSFVAGNERYVEYVTPIGSAQSNLPPELQIESIDRNRMDAEQKRRQTIGAVRLGLSLTRVDSHMALFLKWRGGSIVAFLFLSTLAIYVFSVKITRPIRRLTEQAKKISEGLLDQTIPVNSRDEIGQLAMSFNDMARALNELYSSLERKVAERTHALKVANEKLEEVSQLKSQFLANVNHELRTPVSAIIGYAHLVLRATESQISRLQRENLEDLLRNAERLLNQIDSLLEFSKIEAGKMAVHVEPVEVNEVIQGAISTVESTLNGASVRIIREIALDLPALNTDREKLRQIILNLLDNAVKFTDRGEIKVMAAQLNRALQLTVSDTGIGIEKEELKQIFEEFHRGNSSSAGKYRGTGLGLAIVKKFVNVLGGEINVESEVGKGSVFTVTLPLDRGERV
jgi:signal transduction histidine kinase